MRAGALPLALHPALPFAGTAVDLERLVGTAFGVTAPEPLLPVAEALVLEMGGEPVRLTEEQRPLWHAALAHGANHLTTLVASAADLLRAAGVADPGAVLGPLLGSALDGALRPRRRGAHRPGRPRRRRHRRRPPAGARRRRARGAAVVRRAGAPHRRPRAGVRAASTPSGPGALLAVLGQVPRP